MQEGCEHGDEADDLQEAQQHFLSGAEIFEAFSEDAGMHPNVAPHRRLAPEAIETESCDGERKIDVEQAGQFSEFAIVLNAFAVIAIDGARRWGRW